MSSESENPVRDLLAPYERRLKRFIFGRVRDSHDTDDIYQEVCQEVCKGPADGTQGPKPAAITDPPGYLFGIADKVILKWQRKQGATPTYGAELFTDNHTGTAPDPADAYEAEQLIRKALSGQPKQRLRVLLVFYTQGLNAREIAERLNMNERTVRTHLRLAFLSIATELNRHDKAKSKSEGSTPRQKASKGKGRRRG